MSFVPDFIKEKCRTVMIKHFCSVSEDTPVKEIIPEMERGENCPNAIFVMEEGRVVGIITERCMVRLLRGQTSRHDMKLTKLPWHEPQAHDIMRKVPTHVHEETTIQDALRLMDKFDLYVLPVLSKDETNVLGAVSLHHMLRKIANTKSL